MTNHINTISVKKDNKVIKGQPPDIYGVDGEVFSNILPLHFDSDNLTLHLVKIRRITDAAEDPVNDHEHMYDNVPNDYSILIYDFPTGIYEIRYAAYYEDEGKTVFTPEGSAEFAIINRKNTLEKIGVSEIRDALEDAGFTESGYELIDNYLGDNLENPDAAKGVFITFEIENALGTYHKTTIEFMGEEYEVKYNCAEDRKGILFIPLESYEGVMDEPVTIKTEEYMEEECINLLDKAEDEQPLYMLSTYFINLEREEPFILMSAPKRNVFNQIVNISYNNLNDHDRIAGYIIEENGCQDGLRILSEDNTRIIFNNPGTYKVTAMIAKADDIEFTMPLLVKEETFEIIEHANLVFNVPEKFERGLGFNVQIRNLSEKKIEAVHFKINRYTDNMAACKINDDFYELYIDMTLPKGDHIIFSEVVFNDGTKETLTKGFTIEENYAPHLKFLKPILENTSFIFSGHNINFFAALAEESFILKCGIRREQVCYFNDMSTDKTEEEFIGRKLSMMSWEEDILEDFTNSEYANDLPLRVEMILQSALSKVESRYVCFLDGDNFYYRNSILKLLARIIQNNPEFAAFAYKAVRVKEEDIPKYYGLAERVYQNFLWLDLTQYKKEDLIIRPKDVSELYEKYKGSNFTSYFDTGTILYYRLIEAKRDCVFFDFDGDIYNELSDEMFHIGWLSSAMRNDKLFIGSWDEQQKVIEEFINDESNERLFKECGITKEDLTEQFLKNFKGGDTYEPKE